MDEGQPAAPKRARAARWLRGEGIEIGALHNPLSTPSHVTVRYVDRIPNEQLRQHYPELDAEPLVDVDVIGDAQNLSAFDDGALDFVIANHLVEHLEDPIRGLAEMLRVLKPTGVLYLALPDPRKTFDHERELTTIDHVVDEYRNGPARTREEHFRDWVENVDLEEYKQLRTPAERKRRVRQLMNIDYSIHFHMWRPDTFIEVLAAARREAGLEFEIAEVLSCDSTNDNEYIFILLKGVAETPPETPPGTEQAENAALAATLRETQQRSDAVTAELHHAQTALQALYRSRSWRATRPLRWTVRRGRELSDAARRSRVRHWIARGRSS